MKKALRSIGLLAVAAAMLSATAGAATAPPVTRSAPTIQGSPVVGKTLTATNGLWSNSPTSFSYQWLRCDANGNNCANIKGAASKTYTLASADIGNTIVVLVTAKNSGGSSTANSKPTDVVTPAVPPKSSVLPSITGKPFVGEQLVANPGQYTGGAVDKIAYQWQRCDASGSNCTDIAGATAQTYGVLKVDAKHALRVQVTASNDYGSASAVSKPTAAIQTAPPRVNVTTEMSASRSTTVCCQTVTLSGTVSTHKAGERITILKREADDITSYPIQTATSDASGNWSVKVQPMIATTYVAQTSTSKSNPLTIPVHPRLGLGVSGNNFSAKITARDSFGGAIALFQIQTRSGGWKTAQLVVTNIFSVAKFHVSLRRGRTYNVRIYLPQRQAGFGYLDGTSHVRRVGGTA
jgi:hypothetical protein